MARLGSVLLEVRNREDYMEWRGWQRDTGDIVLYIQVEFGDRVLKKKEKKRIIDDPHPEERESEK